MKSYPHMRFERHWHIESEVQYQLGQCSAMISSICEIPLRPEVYGTLNTVSLIKGAQATTAIEGNTLTEHEIERVHQGETLAPSKEYQEIEVRNILAAMNGILSETLQGADALVAPRLIKNFHILVGKDLGEHFDAIPGHFRTDERFVGPYKCPGPRDVEELVVRLCEWLKGEFGYSAGNQKFRDAVVEAIVCHVYLEWIHPFGDGNGRTGRLLEFYILLRAGLPDIASHVLSSFYNETRPEYYRQLDHAHNEQDLTSFLSYAIQGLRDGLQAILAQVQGSQFETAWKSYIYEQFAERRYRKVVFKRRRTLALDLPRNSVLTLSQIPLVTPEIAKNYGGLAERTVRRDLDSLIEMGLVRRVEGGYLANTDTLRKHMAKRAVGD